MPSSLVTVALVVGLFQAAAGLLRLAVTLAIDARDAFWRDEGNQAGRLKPMEGRIQRAFFHLKETPGPGRDVVRHADAVHGPGQLKGPEDEHLQRSVQIPGSDPTHGFVPGIGGRYRLSRSTTGPSSGRFHERGIQGWVPSGTGSSDRSRRAR